LVELLGGEIGLESEPGSGSVFWFTARFGKRAGESLEAPQEAGRPRERAIRRREPASPRNGRILLAEDSVSNQLVASAILENLGWRVDAVANGREALQSLRSIPYDLVLMDCQMPEMNGYEATAQIRGPRSAVLNPRVPIVAMTAHAMKGDREKCLAVGMNDYVSKPLDPEVLAMVVERWLAPGHVAAPDRAGFGADLAAISRATANPAFREDELMERCLGDVGIARMIIAAFLDDIPGQLAALKSSLAAGEPSKAELYAHKIKGAAGNVSAVSLADVAGRIEAAGRGGDLAGMSALIDELESAFAAAGQAMRTMDIESEKEQ